MLPSYAAGLSFKDVSPEFWGYANIQWAIDNKLVDGYPDGTFKPDREVSQNEFLAMLIRAYEPDDLHPESYKNEPDWALPYLQYGSRKRWDVTWAAPQSPITRGDVARIVANASGKNYSVDDSVQYLLDTGLSDGKTAKTVEGFQKNDTLTRTEAVAFVQRLKSSLKELQSSPADEQKYVVKIPEQPAVNAAIIDQYINLTANTEVYQLPSQFSGAIATIAPQSVQAFEKAGN
nr:S-layer homology domain-containing protein [Paenibacillus hamazuiensis]